MIKIAICDDDDKDIESICRIVDKFFTEKNMNYEIDLYKSSCKLLEKVEKYQMIFLDIELQDENGIHVARQINKKHTNYKLFLVSNYTEYLKDGYRVKADRYFTKPIDYNEFNIDIQEVINDYILNSSFIFDTKISKHKIYVKDIFYVEILARKTYLHTKQGRFSTPYTLTYWINRLENFNFAQSHKSFLVNLQNVEDYDHHNIFICSFKDEKTVPLSRYYKENFITEYISYISKAI